MKLIEGMEVAVASCDYGTYIGKLSDNTYTVLYSGGELVHTTREYIEICDNDFNRRIVYQRVQELYQEVVRILEEIQKLEDEEVYG